MVSTIIATPLGPKPSYIISSIKSLSSVEVCFFIALSILSLVMLEDKALLIADRNLGFESGSGEPSFAETEISLINLEKSFALFLSCAPFRCMIFLNLE